MYAPGPGSADIHNLIGAAPITLGGIIDSTRRDIYDHTVEPNKQQYPDSGILKRTDSAHSPSGEIEHFEYRGAPLTA